MAVASGDKKSGKKIKQLAVRREQTIFYVKKHPKKILNSVQERHLFAGKLGTPNAHDEPKGSCLQLG